MNKQDCMKMQSCVLKVNIHCDGCKSKVMKILQKIDGVYSISINAEQGRVTVTGNVDPVTLLQKLEKSGKHAELWGGQKVTNNMMHNINMIKNMQMANNAKGGKNYKSQKGGKDQQKKVQQIKGHHKDHNLPQKPAKFNMPFDDDDNDDDDDDGFDNDCEFDDDGESEDDNFDGHHHHKNAKHSRMKPFMCNGHESTVGAKKRGNGKKGGLQVKSKGSGKNGGKVKSMSKFTSSFKGLLRKFDRKKCCNERKKGGGDGGKVNNKGSKMKTQGKISGGKKSGGSKGGVKKNKRGKNKGDSNGGGPGEGGHSVGSWDHMIMNEALKNGSLNMPEIGHNGGSGGRNVGHMGQIGNHPISQMGLDPMAHRHLMGQMGNSNVMGPMGNDHMGQMGNTNQMGHNMMGSMGHMNSNSMAQMGNIDMPAVHGLPAGAMPGGYYQSMGQGWNPYNQQQQYMAAAMMNQQQAMHGAGMYHPAMQGRPPPGMSYAPARAPPVTINITEYFSDENPNNCSIM